MSYGKVIRKKKNQDTTEASETKNDSILHQRKIKKVDDRKKFKDLGDKLAQSTIYFRNRSWPNAKDYFDEMTDYCYVDKYYPYAEGGGLWVDEPRDEIEKKMDYEKHEVMRKLGLRHVVIEENSRLDELLMELGEL